MAHEFVGAGWAYPLRLDHAGDVLLATDEDEIGQSIRLILATAPGERPMRPEFGCRIHEQVFAPPSAETAGRVAFYVRASLERWEPRIEVVDVVVTPHQDEQTTLYIDVRYSIRDANEPRNLVFPFYVIPVHEPAPDAAAKSEAA